MKSDRSPNINKCLRHLGNLCHLHLQLFFFKSKKNISMAFESSEDVMRNPFLLLENVQGI